MMMKPLTVADDSGNKHHLHLLAWYLVWGAVHETIHLVSAWMVTGLSSDDEPVPINWKTVYSILLGRNVTVPLTSSGSNELAWVIRHAGWVTSVLIAVSLSRVLKKRGATCLAAAWITAVEAIWTDALQWPTFLPLHASFASSNSMTFFCGNFGVLLLHHAWFTHNSTNNKNDSDSSSSIWNILQTMIRVTMMRGAQSGGVLFWDTSNEDNSCHGRRTRVVNRKRTDLATWLSQKVQRAFPKNRNKIPPCVAFMGHTRFATSSKATLVGTHPQQWTPAVYLPVHARQVPHDLDPGATRKKAQTASRTRVENFVTHNGDFDFYNIAGQWYDVESIQQWLLTVTGLDSVPSPVDSCAVAGLVDVLRTAGCWTLSLRYAVTLAPDASVGHPCKLVGNGPFPSLKEWQQVGESFEQALKEMMEDHTWIDIEESLDLRQALARRSADQLIEQGAAALPLLLRTKYRIANDTSMEDTEDSRKNKPALFALCSATVNAFFDNDLFWTTQSFLQNAKGSFGLCVTSSLDATRQICLAARGQTMSVAFYPRTGLICYGSEQAAVKAGLNVTFPGGEDVLERSLGEVDNDALRLDLDDLGGEIMLLDWGSRAYKNSPVSIPNRDLILHEFMNGVVHTILYQESKATTQDPQIFHRMTRLSRNRFVRPLQPETKDPILNDINDIPKVCQRVQDEWQSDKAAISLNRLTAYNLSRCLRTRLEGHVNGNLSSHAVDILLTGCEVSLWLAEQFASDLQKAFPRLRIMAVSSNKLLGLYGQDISIPSAGFPYSSKTSDLHDTIVIIVSHSGGTFAPLSCSNLFQSTTRNLFVVTSEWDTQIGKQLRSMDDLEDENDIFASRIFSTEAGMRPAEPCSVSVAATHQLLTNLFEYMSVIILSDKRFRRATAAVISEQDLLILERCNRNNIEALSEIVGVNRFGYVMDYKKDRVEKELRAAGDLWSNHILENARAYIMTFVYIFATVVTGYPLVFALAYGAGLDKLSDWMYLVRAVDAAIYFWLPQINITLIRLIQGRNMLHRMVGRTVAIGDIPWVSQSAEAFLSKIFACSYSIAGLNVLSGNLDHFVHRHTHKITRGTLCVVGRPDGRLSALSTAEAATCLSVNQASSIQSLGGTCESITIGHNPFELPLSANGIFLKRKRPLFLCERMLVEADAKAEHPEQAENKKVTSNKFGITTSWLWRRSSSLENDMLDLSLSRHRDSSVNPRVHKKRSAAALIGAYANFEEDDAANMRDDTGDNHELSVDSVVASAIREQKWSDRARKLFQAFDLDDDGFLSQEEFIESSYRLQGALTADELRDLFRIADSTSSGHLDYDEFLQLLHISDLDLGIKLPPSHRNERGVIQIEPSKEKHFGETLRKYNAGKSKKEVDFMVARSQENAMLLYETRIASLQRFVAMTVMFHQMGSQVQNFFDKISFGLLAYRYDRTHSIMRIATTASPIGGADVRERMRQLQLLKRVRHSIFVISQAYLHYKERKKEADVIRE